MVGKVGKGGGGLDGFVLVNLHHMHYTCTSDFPFGVFQHSLNVQHVHVSPAIVPDMQIPHKQCSALWECLAEALPFLQALPSLPIKCMLCNRDFLWKITCVGSTIVYMNVYVGVLHIQCICVYIGGSTDVLATCVGALNISGSIESTATYVHFYILCTCKQHDWTLIPLCGSRCRIQSP